MILQLIIQICSFNENVQTCTEPYPEKDKRVQSFKKITHCLCKLEYNSTNHSQNLILLIVCTSLEKILLLFLGLLTYGTDSSCLLKCWIILRESQRTWKVTSLVNFADRRLKLLLRNFQHFEMNSFCFYSLYLLIDHLKYVKFLLVVFLRLLNLSHWAGNWMMSVPGFSLFKFESLFCVRCGSLHWAQVQLFRP